MRINDKHDPGRPHIAALADYLSARAQFNGISGTVDLGNLELHFDRGIRDFYGVHLNDAGELVWDQNEPDYFIHYHFNHPESPWRRESFWTELHDHFHQRRLATLGIGR